MSYLLFANPKTGSPILTELIKVARPRMVVTQFKNFDSWKRIVYRLFTNKLTVEDKARLFYKLEFYDYKSLTVKRLKNLIEKNNIEIAFITTFSYLIPREMLELFPKGVYNFHPSLLPKHGGANPLFWTIFLDDKYTGTTCHKATDVLDRGETICQSKYPVNNMDCRQLFKLYIKDIKEMVPKILINYDHLIKTGKLVAPPIYDVKDIPQINLNDPTLDPVIKERYKRATKPLC